MPTEDLEAYQRHLGSSTDEYNPKGATESNLVQALADTSWRLNRVAALETNLLTLGMTTPFAGDQQLQDAMSIVASLEAQPKALSNLSLHSQRLSRQFERTVAQLRDLQKTGRDQEARDLDHYLDIMDMVESTKQPYDPTDDGFTSPYKPATAPAPSTKPSISITTEVAQASACERTPLKAFQ
jgi:hypothetical protein